MRIRTRPTANRPRCEQLERGGCFPVKRFGWILAGAVLMALVAGANPGAANAASSPANARSARTARMHLTSARVDHRSASTQRPGRAHPARRAPRPHAVPATHSRRTPAQQNRNLHGRGSSHAADVAVWNDFHHVNTSTSVEAAWLRAPRQSFTAAPETRGPPRASPLANSRPHPSPSRTSGSLTGHGRAPSLPRLQSPSVAPSASSGSLLSSPSSSRTATVVVHHPRASRIEGATARKRLPSGGIPS